jgi:hypothetical protein
LKKLKGIISIKEADSYNDSPNKIRKSMGLESFTSKMQHMAVQMDDNFRNYFFTIDVKIAGF